MTTKYDNTDWSRCVSTGAVTVVILGVDGTGQGASYPCKGCWVQTRAANDLVRMSIGMPATADLGVELGDPVEGAQPLWVPISDISQLYFYGTAFDIVDIVYLLG